MLPVLTPLGALSSLHYAVCPRSRSCAFFRNCWLLAISSRGLFLTNDCILWVVGYRLSTDDCLLLGITVNIFAVGSWLSGVGCRVLVVDCPYPLSLLFLLSMPSSSGTRPSYPFSDLAQTPFK
jgi:hypothetical protein